MKLSVIIPAVNEADQVGRAVACALAAGAQQVVVSDGGSDDETPAIAAREGALVVTGSRGRAVQLNRGAAAASGEFLVFQHADNWLSADCLRQITDNIAGQDAVLGAFRQQIDDARWTFRVLEWGNAARVRTCGLAYGDQAIFIKTELFHRLGGFPELRLMEDLRFMRQARKLAKPVLMPGPLHVSARRWQRHGVVRQTLQNWTMLVMEAAGVHPNRLAKWYAPHDLARKSGSAGINAFSP